MCRLEVTQKYGLPLRTAKEPVQLRLLKIPFFLTAKRLVFLSFIISAWSPKDSLLIAFEAEMSFSYKLFFAIKQKEFCVSKWLHCFFNASKE